MAKQEGGWRIQRRGSVLILESCRGKRLQEVGAEPKEV